MSEKLDWFKIINIAGKVLKPQELRNAFYTGEWLTSAKRAFSKNNCKAYKIGQDYLSGDYRRQEYLETVLNWISEGKIEEYMDSHRDDPNANELWLYFNSVIEWVKSIFQKVYPNMKSVDWGILYNKYHSKSYDVKKINLEVERLLMDKDISHSGIYPYLLGEPINVLHIREFDDTDKRKKYNEQKGICPYCHKHFEIEEMDAHHITQWIDGGHTTLDNCEVVCRKCHHDKTLGLHHK